MKLTKKQLLMLDFIESFMQTHSYSPSYREIANGVGYRSISTVSEHVENLVIAGKLRKQDHSARSLEVMGSARPKAERSDAAVGKAWLTSRVVKKIDQFQAGTLKKTDDIYVLLGALKVLGLQTVYEEQSARLEKLLEIRP